MQVINCSSKLRALETQLAKHLPESLTAHGGVKTIIRGNPFRKEVVVDSWPNFQAVITRPQKQYVKDPFNYEMNAYSAFYKDLGVYRDLLESMGTYHNRHAFQLRGHQNGVRDTSMAMADAKGLSIQISTWLTVQHLDPKRLKDIPLKSGQNLRLSTVEEHHIDLINKMWSLGGTENSRIYLKEQVRHFPNSCLLNEEGNIISWAFSNQFGTMCNTFTMPDYRKKGHNAFVMATVGQKLHHLGLPLNGYVLEENVPSKKMLAHLGFTFMPCPHFIINHTPKQSPTRSQL